MFAIVLADRKGVVHKVYTVPRCSGDERAVVEACARTHDLTAIVAPTESSWSVADICDEITDLHDCVTSEVPAYVPAEERPPAIEKSHTFLELDWDEEVIAR